MNIDKYAAGTAQAVANGDIYVRDIHALVHAGADFVLTVGKLKSEGTIISGETGSDRKWITQLRRAVKRVTMAALVDLQKDIIGWYEAASKTGDPIDDSYRMVAEIDLNDLIAAPAGFRSEWSGFAGLGIG
jgi:hypothetical protein